LHGFQHAILEKYRFSEVAIRDIGLNTKCKG